MASTEQKFATVIFIATVLLSPVIYDLAASDAGVDTKESTAQVADILQAPTKAAQLRQIPIVQILTPTAEPSVARRILEAQDMANRTNSRLPLAASVQNP